MTWWRIVAPHFVAGLRVTDDRVAEAAPILRWTVGLPWPRVRQRLVANGWHGAPLR